MGLVLGLEEEGEGGREEGVLVLVLVLVVMWEEEGRKWGRMGRSARRCRR